EFTAIEACPELAIGGALALGARHEHAVMLAGNLGERIAEDLQENVVGRDDRAVEIELDHGLRARNGRDLAGVIHAANLLCRDVACEFDHLDRLAARTRDRVIRGLNPNLAPAFADPLELPGLVFAEIEIGPERTVFGAVADTGLDK